MNFKVKNYFRPMLRSNNCNAKKVLYQGISDEVVAIVSFM